MQTGSLEISELSISCSVLGLAATTGLLPGQSLAPQDVVPPQGARAYA